MNVPYTDPEQIQTYWEARSNPKIPSDAPQPRNQILKAGIACGNFGGTFEGKIDKVCVHDRKLGREEIADLAAGRLVESALVAHYAFDGSMRDSAGGRDAIASDGTCRPLHEREAHTPAVQRCSVALIL